MTAGPDAMLVHAARDLYFRRATLGPDGGYSARWVWFRIGPLAIPILNTPARRAALPLHDLHHIATGYETSWAGEAEISAWELAAGCGGYSAAWLLNLLACPIGLGLSPRRTWRAFLRGRSARSLYRDPRDSAWLERTVGDLRRHLEPGETRRTPQAMDPVLFAVCALPALGGLLLGGLAVRGVLTPGD